MTTLDAFRLNGKVAMVTGGAQNLGYDMADALAEAGADLVITSRVLAKAAAAGKKLAAAHGVEVLPLALDHTDYAQVAAVMKQAQAWKGRLDILVNNAGGSIGGPCDLFDRPPEKIRAMIDINLVGLLYCCKEAGKIMAAQKRGKIINIASIAGMCGRDRRIYAKNNMEQQPIDYAAAKAGVIGATRDLAGFLSPMGVHVNAISPGGFARKQPGNFEADYSDKVPLGRMGRDGSIDLKGAVLFLASDASDYVTGHNMEVDGGFVMWK